jgi:hypothetical protein
VVGSPGVLVALGNGPIQVEAVRGRLNGVGDCRACGNADLTISLAGSRGRGKLLEWAQNGYESWHLCSLSFVNSNGEQMVLMPDENARCERE